MAGRDGPPYLSHHPIPDVVNLLSVFAIGHQVEVVGELDILGDLFQNVDAEALAALLDVRPSSLGCVAAGTQTNVEEGVCGSNVLT